MPLPIPVVSVTADRLWQPMLAAAVHELQGILTGGQVLSALTVSGAGSLGSLAVAGATSLAALSASSAAISGNETVGGNLTVTGSVSAGSYTGVRGGTLSICSAAAQPTTVSTPPTYVGAIGANPGWNFSSAISRLIFPITGLQVGDTITGATVFTSGSFKLTLFQDGTSQGTNTGTNPTLSGLAVVVVSGSQYYLELTSGTANVNNAEVTFH